MPGTPETPPEMPPAAPRRPIAWLARKSGWAESDTRIRLSAVTVALVLCGFVIFTLERGPGQTVEAVTEQVKAEVKPEVERLVIEAATLGSELVSGAQYVQKGTVTPSIILRLKIQNIPDNCVEKPLMIYLVRADRSVVNSWRPKILLTYSMVRLQTGKLPSGLYDVDVQACGGAFPPSEGRTVLRIP